MYSEERSDINECKTTLKGEAERWLVEGVSSVTIVSAFAEVMAEVSVALVGHRPTIELLKHLDHQIQKDGRRYGGRFRPS